MTIGERIKELRKNLGMTQKAFADALQLKQNTVATYEMGRLVPSDRAIADICREFNVREEWLRTGEGPMFADLSRQKKIAAFIGDLMAEDKDDSFKLAFIEAISQMTPEEWALVEKMARRITGGG